ncbi:acyl-CoA dehydrogenase [Solibacillus sp. R5-41]|uniref:acyl-CoA dehydrogenase n=1 Tax=Solibacillus sp. R5-41 TaxID=2048654 RepID=UPI000C128381|nr:acyl-CoA dehydrogenase [Solibacillus sp. R5-41]ATP39549.1 acyl-CoA dehydrogenase [Solibacillus sp. R5-41]
METTFTYEKFEVDGILTLLDPLYILALLFSALLLIAVLRFTVNPKIMLFVSVFTILLMAQIHIIGGILADELNLGDSSKNFYFLIAIVIVQVGIIIISYTKSKKK